MVPATIPLGGDVMPTLSIDIETFSEVDLPKAGVYAYSDHPSFEILLFAYAFDDEPTGIIDLKCGEQLPRRVLDALTDPACIKTAFNAAFERTCISRYRRSATANISAASPVRRTTSPRTTRRTSSTDGQKKGDRWRCLSPNTYGGITYG